MHLPIECIEILGVEIPLSEPFRISKAEIRTQKSAVVRITAGGVVGLGNVDPTPGYSLYSVEAILASLERRVGPSVLGRNAMNIHDLLARMDAVQPGLEDAKAAIEMACVDIASRAMGIPVHTWLGGAVKDRLLFNGWIGIDPPDVAARKTAALQRAGYCSAKIKVGKGIEADRDRIRAVREACGPDFRIRMDANCGYDADTSIRLARSVAGFGIELYEQPVPEHDIEGMARVRREGAGVPVMADESVVDTASLIRIIRAEAADIVKFKVMKQGGFLRTIRLVATAEAAGMRCVVGHGFGLGVNTMAEIMLCAACPNVLDGIECVGPLKTTDDIVVAKLDLSAGALALPPGPGLGVTLDDAKVARYRSSRVELRS